MGNVLKQILKAQHQRALTTTAVQFISLPTGNGLCESAIRRVVGIGINTG